MAVPQQIQKQSEDVQKLYANMHDDVDDDGVATDTSENKDGVQAAEGDGGSDSVVDNATSASTNEQIDAEAGDEETFAHKYKTLQGMYNADIARLQASNTESSTRIQQMEQLLSGMQAEPVTQPETVTQPKQLVSAEDVEEYGDSIDVMRKVSKEELSPLYDRIASLESTLNGVAANLNGMVIPQVQQVARQQAVGSEEAFWSNLAQQVPEWQTINNSPDFQAWLLETDMMLGSTRQVQLEDAQSKLDVNRVAAFFRAFAPSGDAPTPQTAQPTRSASELEKQVSPGRSRSAAAPADQKAKVWTPDEIAAFYRDVQMGKYRGKEKERDRLERDVFAAKAQGRLTNNPQ